MGRTPSRLLPTVGLKCWYLKDARDACSSVNGYLVQAQDAEKQDELETVVEVDDDHGVHVDNIENYADLKIEVLHSLVAPEWSWWLGLTWDGVNIIIIIIIDVQGLLLLSSYKEQHQKWQKNHVRAHGCGLTQLRVWQVADGGRERWVDRKTMMMIMLHNCVFWCIS